jgi:hypothetical protein
MQLTQNGVDEKGFSEYNAITNKDYYLFTDFFIFFTPFFNC